MAERRLVELRWSDGDSGCGTDLMSPGPPSGEAASLMQAYWCTDTTGISQWWENMHKRLRFTTEKQSVSAVVLRHLLEARVHSHLLGLFPGDESEMRKLKAALYRVDLWIWVGTLKARAASGWR